MMVVDPFAGRGKVGDRLDVYLAETIPGLSRSFLQKRIQEGTIQVRNPGSPGRLKTVKASYALRAGDLICLSEDLIFGPAQWEGKEEAEDMAEPETLEEGKPGLPRLGGPDLEAGESLVAEEDLPELPWKDSMSWARGLASFAEDLPLDIIYEDSYLAVINKARGMVVHPGVGHPSGTLANALAWHWENDPRLPGFTSGRPGILHRIDKDTSGLLLCVRDQKVFDILSQDLRAHRIQRGYTAYVEGEIPLGQRGRIDAPLKRDPVHWERFTVGEGGRVAVTEFMSEAVYDLAGAGGDSRLRSCWPQVPKAVTKVRVDLVTGRTHQIRAHFAYLNHPLLGDPIYNPVFGKNPPPLASLLQGQALHAGRLTFTHPKTGESLHFEVPLPADLEALEKYLQKD
mgnify:CR=1 FL=1